MGSNQSWRHNWSSVCECCTGS
ncbi:unnamed protein product [Linum tenue]|uniref:Uncharacterized protein n=1 Tax=Linum tenue TaxID=586396 RepID=A0AAV0NZI1_9ROSI|nr:unnamed protein product [Linum tenue]